MKHNLLPLLSIIIPTKNRQHTCMYAIESVLLIQTRMLEVIIQDCSDTDKLKKEIFLKFGNDDRIKYFYDSTSPSMTENWNAGIFNTTGKYLCCIGDDDAVLPACFEITKWMDENHVEALQGANVNYIWKDAATNSYTNSRVSHNMHYTGDIFEVDTQKEFKKVVINCGFGYTEDLTNLYHGIIEKRLLEIHKNKCGCYLSGTSLDVYNAIILPSYLEKSYYVDYPLTMRGTSGSSNSNRINSKKSFNAHFKDFKNLYIPEMLPSVLNAEVSTAESTIIALQDTNQESLILLMNLAIVYGKCAAFDLSNFFNYYHQYKIRKNIHNTNKDFINNFFIFLKQRIKSFIKNMILKMTFKIVPNWEIFIEKYANRRRATAPDILAANQILKEHLLNKKMSINYDGKSKKLVSKKMPWE